MIHVPHCFKQLNYIDLQIYMNLKTELYPTNLVHTSLVSGKNRRVSRLKYRKSKVQRLYQLPYDNNTNPPAIKYLRKYSC